MAAKRRLNLLAAIKQRSQSELEMADQKNSSGTFSDREKASEAGKKGGQHSHGQSGESSGDKAQSSGTQGGTHEQHVEAGKQSHKNQ